ncbi:MAG: DUF3277 family protein, partial [Ruminococcus flavefaciens]|nr:DUF3277 family protein [Ruminococcus flavefaciens]
KDCSVVVDRTVNITGLGESMVAGSKDEDNFAVAVGAQGDVCVSDSNNPLGTIKITLQQTSPQMKTMLDYANSKKVFKIWITNKKLKERFGGSQAMIKKVADVEWGAEASEKEFEISVFDYVNEPIN